MTKNELKAVRRAIRARYANPVYVATIAQPFTSDHSRREHVFCVLTDGTVTVWDPVADAYTSCHSLSDADTASVRALAGR